MTILGHAPFKAKLTVVGDTFVNCSCEAAARSAKLSPVSVDKPVHIAAHFDQSDHPINPLHGL